MIDPEKWYSVDAVAKHWRVSRVCVIPGWKRCPESAVLGSEFCHAHSPTKSSGSRDSSASRAEISPSEAEIARSPLTE
jgi:hypothetical protein